MWRLLNDSLGPRDDPKVLVERPVGGDFVPDQKGKETPENG